jgi:hypothetical protein
VIRMKTLQELQLKTTDITAILPKRIAEFVEEVAREKRYGRQLLRINRDLVRTKGRSLHLASRGAISAARVAEGGTPTEQKVSWTTTEVTPFKIGTAFHVTQEAIDGAEIDLINGHFEEAAEAMAELEDLEIFYELCGRQPDPSGTPPVWSPQEDTFTGDGVTTTFTLSKSPVIEMSTVTVAGTETKAYTVDYYDGKIKFATAPASGAAISVKYWYSKRGLAFDVVDPAKVKQLSYEDMVKAKTEIRSQGKVTPNVVVMHPAQYSWIIKDDRFIDTSRYGSREGILNGEVGKIAGLQVLVTTHVPDGTVLYLASERAGWLVIKRDIQVKRKPAEETDSFKFYFYQEFAPKVTDDKAVAITVNHASNAENL